MTGFIIKRGHWDRDWHILREDDIDRHGKTATDKARRRAWNRSFPTALEETLSISWPWTSSPRNCEASVIKPPSLGHFIMASSNKLVPRRPSPTTVLFSSSGSHKTCPGAAFCPGGHRWQPLQPHRSPEHIVHRGVGSRGKLGSNGSSRNSIMVWRRVCEVAN